MNREELLNKVKTELPESPGVYIMKNDGDEVIYVGKAKSLKRRVKSYFDNTPKTQKTYALVSNIDHFEYILTNSELDAFSLECNLIKKYMPKYNILLKDDKSFPYIKIDMNEKYPRVQVARRPKPQSGVLLFGPYVTGTRISELMSLIKSAYSVRWCNTNFDKKPFLERPCVHGEIGNCVAPCVSLENAKKVLGCEKFKGYARDIADKSITLVKEQKGVLPLTAEKYKRVLVYDIESGENPLGYARASGIFEKVRPLLEKEGFAVTRFVPKPGNEGKTTPFKEIAENYDLILYFCNLATKSNQTTVRIEWLNPMGSNVPRYVASVPTVFISTENPYHLLDVPMVRTYVNTYGINEYTLPLLVDKLVGRSAFTGKSPVDPFCGKWDARRTVE